MCPAHPRLSRRYTRRIGISSLVYRGGVFPYVFRQFLAKFFIYCCFSATDRPFFTSDLRNKCFMSGGQNTFYQIHPDSCTEHPKQSLKCAGHNTGSATSGALLYCFHTKALSFRADPAFKQRPQPHMALIPVLTLRPHQNRAHRASGGYDLGRQRQPRHIKKSGRQGSHRLSVPPSPRLFRPPQKPSRAAHRFRQSERPFLLLRKPDGQRWRIPRSGSL